MPCLRWRFQYWICIRLLVRYWNSTVFFTRASFNATSEALRRHSKYFAKHTLLLLRRSMIQTEPRCGTARFSLHFLCFLQALHAAAAAFVSNIKILLVVRRPCIIRMSSPTLYAPRLIVKVKALVLDPREALHAKSRALRPGKSKECAKNVCAGLPLFGKWYWNYTSPTIHLLIFLPGAREPRKRDLVIKYILIIFYVVFFLAGNLLEK